jgi:hypothetical protein
MARPGLVDVAGPDPVLGAPELAGRLLLPADVGQEDGVHLAQETLAQRQRRGDAVVQGGAVVQNLADVHAGGLAGGLRAEDVRERGLGSFDPGAVQRFLQRVGRQQVQGTSALGTHRSGPK